jgi:uncharacterized protein
VDKTGQDATIAFLSRPESYAGGVAAVETIATHASMVFLAGDCAYKLKRAVKYPYLDFSTPELRRRACETELTLNRRTAPTLYLAVRPLFRTSGDDIAWQGPGMAIDWVVVMRRFAQSALFDRLAGEAGLTAPLMTLLADRIAAFHDDAERMPDYGGSAGIGEVVAMNEGVLSRFMPSVFDAQKVDALCAATRAALTRVTALLEKRRLGGKVRHCHGDLHLGNICLIDGQPTLFDCIEFSRSLAAIDVLYDLAFLLMDLEHRGQRRFANLVFNRYLDRTDEADGIATVRLFASLRATIRAHVTATAAENQGKIGARKAAIEQANSYLDLAGDLLRPVPARLVAVGGLSGTGKSTLATALAPAIGAFPGARILRSDVIRKRLLGVKFEEHCPAEGYAQEITETVYAQLRLQAADALAAGQSVVLDAVAADPAERSSFAAAAEAAGVAFTGLWLEAPPSRLEDRIRRRRNDVSDATVEVLHRQLDWDIGRLDWVRIDAGGGPHACLATAARALGMTATDEDGRDVTSENR